jgi:hypothetical protein
MAVLILLDFMGPVRGMIDLECSPIGQGHPITTDRRSRRTVGVGPGSITERPLVAQSGRSLSLRLENPRSAPLRCCNNVLATVWEGQRSSATLIGERRPHRPA